ncbi:MAG TPA: archaemetzincin family Zn-dependent metalloprotease [Thermoanaerobaculia bacterium]|nr:archaemetzincin family Zn-dependent metalloprotease [Thermoanaerobaculia bacterium]
MSEVLLLWIGVRDPAADLLEGVRRSVAREFEIDARVSVSAERPEDAFDARRGQHSSTRILAWLQERREGAHRVLGVTDADLFIPILTFVFGEAQLGGRAAVVSTARLGDTPLIPGEPARIALRLQKEAVHELGHTFGLLHCADARCAMARSPSLRHVDEKSPVLCRACRARTRELSENGDVHEQEEHANPDRR